MKTDTKTALLDAAEHAARHHGIDGFSYADLAAEVGIRKASIHYHFPTKADLSVAMLQRYRANIERLRDETAESVPAAQRLAAIVARYREALGGGQRLCLCVALIASVESLSPEMLEEIARFRAMMRAWLTDVFRQAAKDGSIANTADPASEAAAALALLEGAQLTARAARDEALFDNAVALLLDRTATSA